MKWAPDADYFIEFFRMGTAGGHRPNVGHLEQECGPSLVSDAPKRLTINGIELARHHRSFHSRCMMLGALVVTPERRRWSNKPRCSKTAHISARGEGGHR